MQRPHASAALAPILVTLAAVVLSALAPSPARADHSMYAGFGAGVYNDLDCCRLHGRAQGEIGWHIGRGDDTGFLLELDAIGTFGPSYWMFTGGIRLGGDIQVHSDRHFALLLRPSGLFGVGARDYDGDGRGPYGHMMLQPAFDLRFVLADRFIVLWLRPVAFDFLFWWDTNDRHDWYASAAYQALGGIDFQF